MFRNMKIASSVLDRVYAKMYIPGMEIRHIIQELLTARDWRQEDLASALGTKQNYVSRWLSGVEPRGAVRDRILEMARDSGVIEEERGDRTIIPIMGEIGAGDRVEPDYDQPPPEGFDQVELPFSLGDGVIGFRVKGDSMRPKYEAGAIVVVEAEQTRATSYLVGDIAAVRTADGYRYLKRIMPGPKHHLYNLDSVNGSVLPIVGARIVWAGAVIATIEPKHAKPVARSKKQSKSVARPQRGATK